MGMDNTNKATVVRDDTAQPRPLLQTDHLSNSSLHLFTSTQLAQVKKSAMIQCIKTFPALWDSHDQSAKNQNYCKLLWDNIGEVLNIDVKQAKIGWKRLRNSYKRYYLARNGKNKPPKNKSLESLSFLENEIIEELKQEMKIIEKLKTPSTVLVTANEEQTEPVEVICCDSDDDEDDCLIVETSIEGGESQVANKSVEKDKQTPGNVSLAQPGANAGNTNKPLFIRPRKMEDLLKPAQAQRLNNSSNSPKKTTEALPQIQPQSITTVQDKLATPLSPNGKSGVIIFKPTKAYAKESVLFVSNAFPTVNNDSVTTTIRERSISSAVNKRKFPGTPLNIKCVRSSRSTQTNVLPSIEQNLIDSHFKSAQLLNKSETESKQVDSSSIENSSSSAQVSSSNQIPHERPREIASTSMTYEQSGSLVQAVTSSQPEEEFTQTNDSATEIVIDGNSNTTFLSSLLPDIYSMSYSQFRTFKKHSTNLASMILDS